MARNPFNKNPRRRRNGTRAKAESEASRPKETRRGGRILPLLGLGALGLVAAALLRRPTGRPARGDAGLDPHRRSDFLPSADDGTTASYEPSADDTVSWIAGPAGNLRLLERHVGGQHAVVFIHGLGGCLEQWLPLLDCTGPAIHGVALDLPGHGDSELEDAAHGATVEGLARSVQAVLDSLRLRRVILVGHDLGAAVALQVAAHHPARVRGVFLVDPNGDQSRLVDRQKQQVVEALSQDPLDEVRWQFQQILASAKPRVADRVLADLARSRPDALLEAVRSSLSFAPGDALAKYDGPSHVLVSELNDLPYSLHKVIPEISWSLLPEASHWLMMDSPQGVWESLVDFLDRQVMTDGLAPNLS